MVASPGDPPQVSSARVALVEQVREHDIGRRPLIGRDNVLLAEATEQGHYAGRAWLHLDHDGAGIYDMEIWPPFRRQGLGRELLTLLVTEGKRRGARTITLNATPDGEKLFTSCAFTRVGEGRTWWRRFPGET
jgi:GNAT superfamily N-acetyltransferase